MDHKQFQLLVASIREHGQQEPIVVYKGKILDGRNRAGACANLQIKPKTVEYTGKDPLAFVMAANLHRRHLTTSQRAMVAAKVANIKAKTGKRSKMVVDDSISKDTLEVSIEQAAEQLSVSPISVRRARVVQTHGDDDLIEAVEQGKVTVTAAERVAKPSAVKTVSPDVWPKAFKRLLDKATDKQLKWAAKVIGERL